MISKSQNKAAAEAFVRFLYSPQGQTLLGGSFYRPALRSVIGKFNFPVRPDLFTIEYLGGWAKVTDSLFDLDNGIVTKIQQGLGRATR